MKIQSKVYAHPENNRSTNSCVCGLIIYTAFLMPKLFQAIENGNYHVSSRARLNALKIWFLISVIAIYYAGLSRGNCCCPREQNTAPANGRTTCQSQPRKQSLWDWIQARKGQWPVAASPGSHGRQVKRILLNRTHVCRILKHSVHLSSQLKIIQWISLSVLYPTILAYAFLINVTFINFGILLI